MKKILLLIALICACSCCSDYERKEYEQRQHERKQQSIQDDCNLYEITFNGETHEYVYFNDEAGNWAVGSLTHWAGCKYCKQNGYHYDY